MECSSPFDPSLEAADTDIKCSQELLAVEAEIECRETEERPNIDSSAITGWLSPLAETPVTIKKKKRKRESLYADSDRRLLINFTDHMWGGCIETVTYRYIPNNGCYRNIKSYLSQQKNSHHRKPSPRLMLSTEQRRLQRNITSELRKEFRNLLHPHNGYFKIDDSLVHCEDGEETSISCDTRKQEAVLNEVKLLAAASQNPEPVCSVPLPKNDVLLPEDLRDHRKSLTIFDLPGRTPKPERNVKSTDGISREQTLLRRDELRASRAVPTTHAARLSTDKVDSLASETFCVKKLSNNAKPLRPVERVSASMREVHDNSSACSSISRFIKSSTPDIGVVSIGLTPSKILQETKWPSSETARSSVDSGKGYTTIKYTTPSNGANYRVNRLGEPARSKIPNKPTIDINKNDINTFLPSISGKGISAADFP